jgi:hypothetical protein
MTDKLEQRARELAKQFAELRWMDSVGTLHENDMAPAIAAALRTTRDEALDEAQLKIAEREAKHRHDCRNQNLSTQRRNQALSHRAEAEECFWVIRVLKGER